MTNVRRRCAVLVLIALGAAGCGGGDDDTSPTAPAGTEAPPATVSDETTETTEADQPPLDDSNSLTPDMCAALDEEEPPADLAEVVPSAYADAAQLLLDLSDSFDLDQSMSSDVIDRFVSPGIGTELAAFADAAERDCGASEASEGIRAYAGMAAIGAIEAKSDYCEQLATVVSLDNDDEQSESAVEIAMVVAPDDHAEALDTLRAIVAADDGVLPATIDQTQAFSALAGLGLYAEARCGVPDAFGTMLFAAAFLSLAGGLDGSTGTAPTGLGGVPTAADPAAATAAVPAGSSLSFEVIEIDLEDDGDYLVSAVVPAGWERDDSFFGTVFENRDEFGFFTELTFDTGCDGMCETTDWATRLTGADGFIGLFRESGDLIIDRPTEGTSGVVLVKPGFSDGIEGRVIRWDDATDRYFECKFELDEDDVDLVDTFVALCEAAVPGWISAA